VGREGERKGRKDGWMEGGRGEGEKERETHVGDDLLPQPLDRLEEGRQLHTHTHTHTHT
jgi:hypothetical protein